MIKLVGIFGLFFTVMGFFALWTPILRPAGYDFETMAFVNVISLWSGLGLLCVAAALTLWRHPRRSINNPED